MIGENPLSGGDSHALPTQTLELVESVSEIRQAVKRFNDDAPFAKQRARTILRQTTYWVLDGLTGMFGPSKFVGFVDLDFGRYERAGNQKLPGARFDGGVTSRAIERIVGVPYGKDARLVERLRAWGANLLGADVFEGVSGEGKWQFLTLPAQERRYWKIAPGEKARLWSDLRDRGIIAIGWGEVGDVAPFKGKDALALRIKDVFRNYKDGTVKTNAAQIWTFAHEVGVGDILVANQGTSRIVGIGEVTGPYEFRPERQEYPHTLPVRWFDVLPRDIPEQGAWVRTVLELPKERYETLFSKAPNGGDGMPTNETSNLYAYLRARGLHFPTELVTTYVLSLKTKPFVVLSGISGTGKTKLAQAVAEWAGTEEREIEDEAPATEVEHDQDMWLYQLKPYNFHHRKLIIAKEYEDLFDLPDEGSQPIGFQFEGASFQGTLGALTPQGRRLHELRLGRALSARLGETLEAGDYVSIRVATEGDKQVVTLARIDKRQRTRTETIRRHAFVSVRADWLDGKDVLGFYNLLTEEYVSRPFLDLLLRAHRDRGHPYFVILDEMNLARVEHYFADLLSATESRMQSGEDIRQEPVHLHDLAQCTPVNAPDTWQRPVNCAGCRATADEIDACGLHFDGVQLVPPRLRVPMNVCITGTVNVDETTHMFSPKVLDRANVIEFNRVDLLGYGGDDDGVFKLRDGHLPLGSSNIAGQSDFHALPTDTRDMLIALNDLLAEYNLHFGYRVANELALYIKNAAEYVGEDARDTALDLQVLQKVLPKLHGPKQKLAEPLGKLLLLTVFGTIPTETRDDVMSRIETAAMKGTPAPAPNGGEPVMPRMPRSATKIARMLRSLRLQGFASFIE